MEARSILYLFSPFFHFFHRLITDRQKVPVILVCYTGKLGDLVCLTGVMRAFKESRPSHRIVLIARAPFTEIFSNNPFIDEVISFRSDRELRSFSWMFGVWRRLSSYSVAEVHVLVEHLETAILGLWFHCPNRHLLVTTNRRSTKALLGHHYHLHPFPYTTRIKHWYLSEFTRVTPSDKRYPNELFFPGNRGEIDREWEQFGLAACERVIGVLPSSGKDFKRWPEEYWKSLIRTFDAVRYGIVLFGAGSDERAVINRLASDLHGRTLKLVNVPLTMVPYYIKKCSLVVGVDTGLIYIADALGVPVVDIMGPVDEVNQRPEHRFVLVKNDEMCPRVLQTPPRRGVTADDIISMNRCFESITVDQVFTSCKEMLEK